MSKIENFLQKDPPFVSAVVAFMVKEDAVLLGVRKRVSNGLGQDLISGIGGKLEEGETTEEALVREFIEEIKVKPTSYMEMGSLTFGWLNKPKWNQKVTVYLIDKWKNDPEETDVIKPIWYKKNDLPLSQTWEDNTHWLPLVLNNQKVSGTFLYDENGKMIEHILELNPVETAKQTN